MEGTCIQAPRLDLMMEPRYTSVMRSTRSGNYYNVPISPEVLAQSELGPELATFANYDGAQHEAVAAAWGSATMRRLPAMGQKRDLNAGLGSTSGSKDPQALQPAFAFDLNKLVASLTKSSSSSSLGSSFASSRGAGASGEPQPEPMPEARIHVLPVEPVMTPQRQRGRRDALSGEELSRSYGPPAGPENSIITYSLNKRKQKRLAAKALAAASVNGPNFEYVVADAGNEYQPQYVPRYVPQYQADTTATPSVAGSSNAGSPPSRRREPSVDQESYAF
ncbi:hypothetical protein BBJ28_00009705 [Nothophytophthora sp. Chile5]|nr:hypothetical protein BBJ28_00009705 [Nothophytophthora sp. Chile5]